MTPEVVTITPEVTLPEAHHLMTDHHIRCLPVVDREGQVVGVITKSDIFRMIVQAWGQSDFARVPATH